ncbi:MAG TPA: hypothetical protein PLT92_13845 [Ignavibacteriaceae bacterium]|nr:hypothetical protein [Ignavibacteriaceae bacterium]
MLQSKPLTLQEALIFVEKTAKSSAGGKIPPIQPFVSQVLMRTGIPVLSNLFTTEVALFSSLIMSLVYHNQCNALILTDTKEQAELFFSKSLFSNSGPKGSEFAMLCGKSLKLLNNNSEIKLEIENALHDFNIIPVMDLSTLKYLDNLIQPENTLLSQSNKKSFISKLLSKSPQLPPPSSLKQGLDKLNCSVKVFNDKVSLDGGVGSSFLIY